MDPLAVIGMVVLGGILYVLLGTLVDRQEARDMRQGGKRQ